MSVEQQLIGLIQNGDPNYFLKEYLNLAIQGYNVPIPSGLELNAIKEGWDQIMSQTLGASPSDEFISGVSSIWHTTVTKQGGQMNENFAQDMLNIMEGRPPVGGQPAQAGGEAQQSAASSAPGISKSEPTSSPEAPQPGSSAVAYSEDNPTVSSTISANYRTVQSLKKKKLIPRDQLQTKIYDAVKKGKPSEFLRHYLSLKQYGENPEVPFELSQDAIQKRWDKIISFEICPEHPEDFFERLSELWLNLVHSAGPLTSPNAIDNILEKLEIDIAKKASSEVQEKKPVKKQKEKFSLGKFLIKYLS